ncbi:hypothetical protein KSB_85900 [Ktedonobacter robiniae]|uniref:Uncharacterized protein n=1 Tax=Ktedonobacter robiniae TaxID=2778365 RepID=A0ABQ3V6R9_9CHLR|nr:hypothetical protein KSB_85900 [Ktedonobacter robiniae]
MACWVRGTGAIGGADASSSPRRDASTRRAIPAMVGSSNRLMMESSTWTTARMREIICVASREWPPN